MVSQLAGCAHRWDGSRGERLALPVATTEDGLLRCDYDLVRSVVRQDDVAREEDRGTVIQACTVSKRNRASAKPESLSALVLACLTVLSRKLSDMARMRHAVMPPAARAILARHDDFLRTHDRACHVRGAGHRVESSHPICLVSHTRTHSAVHSSHRDMILILVIRSHTQQPLATHFLLCLLAALLRPTRDPFLLSLSCQRRTRAA